MAINPVWDFEEQPDKFGYLNNPRWSDHPKGAADAMSATQFCEAISMDHMLDHEIHKPCGHWHKRRAITISTYPGNLYACGDNHSGQLGLLDYPLGYNSPHTLADGSWLDIACGYWHSIAIKNDGTLWATGENQNGQLGLGDTTDRYEWEQVGSATDWAKVFCGTNCSLAIKDDGSLYCWGANDYYQLGLGHENDVDNPTLLSSDSWLMVAAGEFHLVAIKSDGTLWGSGDNSCGQLGFDPGAISEKTTLSQLLGTGWTDVGCCGYDTLVLKNDGTLWGTGYNWAYELGMGHDNEVDEFTQIGSDTDWSDIDCGATFSLAIKTSGALYGAGNNAYGELGTDWAWPDDEYIETFTQIGTDTDWEKVIGGIEASAAIKTNGELWMTGNNNYGELGLGDHTRRYGFVQVSGSYSEVSVGWNHSVVINSDNELKGMGNQRYGPLGTGYVTNITKLTLANDDTWLAVDCWYIHALAIKDDKSLYGTGYNSYGQLGLDDRTYLRYVYTLINSALSWKQVATGWYHSLALTEDGVIYSFGYNYYGQLGLGVFGTVSIYRYYEVPTIVDGNDWEFISAGSNVSFAIKTDGTLYACGSNSGGNNGQLGLGDTLSRSSFTQCIGTGWKQVSVGSCHAAAVRDDGTLWTTGKNTSGQLGLGDYTQRIIWTQVADSDWDYVECGYNFTLAVKTDGSIYGTGLNSTGQLGLNDTTNRNTFTKISDGWLHGGYDGMAEFSGADTHSSAIYGNNYIKTTGEDLNGQLAIGEIGALYERDEFDDIVDSIPIDGEQDFWEFTVCGLDSTFALKIVSGTETTTYNDDDEPQVWSLPTGGPSL